jgi:hypothetical protein
VNPDYRPVARLYGGFGETAPYHRIIATLVAKRTPPVPDFILRADLVSEPLILGLHGSAAFHHNIALYDHDGSFHPH